MCVVKIIEVIGTSSKGFDEALKQGLRRCSKTVDNITGLDIISQKAVVKNNRVVEYKVNMKVAFVVK